MPQRPKVFSLWQPRCLCQAGAWQPKQQHKRQYKQICGGIASSGFYKCGYKLHLPLGWQALVATKAEGLFSLAASLPLPSGAWQPKQQHKRLILPKCFSLPLWIFQVAIMLYLQEYHSLNHA
ncbi:MAG: hypothetical protein PHN71_07815 [Candidatus Cloacimonetes bacterium]|nr:hypothetical protein [Candidatus Cloacimonadota bacterium]